MPLRDDFLSYLKIISYHLQGIYITVHCRDLEMKTGCFFKKWINSKGDFGCLIQSKIISFIPPNSGFLAQLVRAPR